MLHVSKQIGYAFVSYLSHMEFHKLLSENLNELMLYRWENAAMG
jgi:hypothetical protein